MGGRREAGWGGGREGVCDCDGAVAIGEEEVGVHGCRPGDSCDMP